MLTGRGAGRAWHGPALIPSEAMDHTHPDHAWWVGSRIWCYDQACPDHNYGPPKRPDCPEEA